MVTRTTVEVKAWQVELIDPAVNANKFYRCMVLPDGTEVRQYGRRSTTGQFQILRHAGVHPAYNSARQQIAAKERKGYHSRIEFSFEYLHAGDVEQNKHTLGHVAESYLWNERQTIPPARPDPEKPTMEPAESANIATLADKALSTISLAVSNPEQGYVEFAQLQSEWVELEEQVAKARGYLDTLETLIGM